MSLVAGGEREAAANAIDDKRTTAILLQVE